MLFRARVITQIITFNQQNKAGSQSEAAIYSQQGGLKKALKTG